jgi:hypothetical protein
METKVCRNCNIEKDISEYHKVKDNYLHYNCNTCRSAIRRENTRKVKAEAVKYKGGHCVDCSSVVHLAAFEFHHIDPSTKEQDPTRFIQGTKYLSDKAKEELDKCVLLCANCHRVRHFSDLF